jgi:hypothetical protein
MRWEYTRRATRFLVDYDSSKPMLGMVLLALGVFLFAIFLLRSRGSRRRTVRLRTGDVHGQVVVAEKIEGGVSQVQDSGPTPKPAVGAKSSLGWLDLVLGIVASLLAIAGALLLFQGG